MKLQFEVFALIDKPAASVFDAVYNPKKLVKYFATKTASAPLQAGSTVVWDFADYPGAFPVRVTKSVKNKLIELRWQAADGKYDTKVVFKFKAAGPRRTKVTIAESGWRPTPEGLAASYMNCFGWSQMLCAMKVYLERGWNLRKGFFKPA